MFQEQKAGISWAKRREEGNEIRAGSRRISYSHGL
jgi:hypothetical protein